MAHGHASRGRVRAQQIETTHGTVWVIDQGPQEGPAVLLLHALGTDLSIWDALASRLSETRRVLR
ncbi:MAG: hypothetical protein ABI343_14365, partial [Burkholderiaceae bacterium]